ncbi:MAG: ABC transporter ATP-binding protein [Candidatus Eremiobacteraeota bacterium]|nr:ABC transporter ATP-binding protein [Candidatus Eremiobacteraeota bacterium]
MILELKEVSKAYGSIQALRRVSFSVDRDEIVALLGPNGAGKTTAIEIALGLRSADGGSATVFGESPRRTAVRRRIGVTPQDSGFPDMLRVAEIVEFVAAHYPDPMALSDVLSDFGLEELAKRRAGTLSGGESRRLALALAFAGNPELVVLDEPTTGLDVESRRRLWRTLRTFCRDRCVIFTTHYLEEAEVNATRVVVLDRGRTLFDGEPEALRARVGRRSVSYVGANGRVAVRPDDADEYVRTLVRSGNHFSDLEVTRPSLEEAFLALTGASR